MKKYEKEKTDAKYLKHTVSLLLAMSILLGVAAPAMAITVSDDTFVLDGTDSAVYQLENGQPTGAVSVSNTISGYTDEGYLSGFTSGEDSVSFDVNVTVPGIYGLSIRSALYMENQALGKSNGQTSSHTQTAGDVTDGNPERGSYWGSGQPVTEENPKWLQLDLGSVMPVHMVRIRIVTDWSSRTETFSVLGSVDGQTFTTLKDTAEYKFVPAGKGNLSGNYVDAEFDTAEVRYVRILFTAISDTGTNGAQVGEFEVYSPVRSARLYLDGSLISEFYMDVDANNIVSADWDSRVLSWAENKIGELALTSGIHNIAIKYGGSVSGDLNLDSLTFNYKVGLDDEAVVNVLNLINALKPVYKITAGDAEQITMAKEAYDALSAEKQALIPALSLEKLNAAVRRIGLIGDTVAISNLVCYDNTNSGGWSVETNLQIGDMTHGDRTFVFNDIPSELWGCDWIRPAMESKRWNSGSVLVSFDVGVTTNLYVAWDHSAPVPLWLGVDSGFIQTNLSLSISNTDNTVYDLFQKSVTAGQKVSLGYLGMDKASYIVLLEHFTVTPSQNVIEDTSEYPVLDSLTVNDSVNADLWSIEENLQAGDLAYGDSKATFTEVPEFLAGSTWVKPASASGKYSGETLFSATANRDGYLYLALEEQTELPAFIAAYEKTDAVLKIDNITYNLYRTYVDAGSRVEVSAQNTQSSCYIVIMKNNTVSSSPDRPSISRFMAPFDTDGWYFVRESFDIGSKLFTNADDTVTELPEFYRGCDYIQTYRDDKRAIYFYAEREIEVAVTVDTRLSTVPSWLMLWDYAGETVKTGERTYDIYTKEYEAGEFITIPKLADTEYDNYIVIVKPVDEGKGTTDNPLVPEGSDQSNDVQYSYYANDVFNLEDDGAVPDGYLLKGGQAGIFTEEISTLINLAFRRHYIYSTATTDQYVNATDGHETTYWEAISTDSDSFIDVDLGSVKDVDTVVIKLNPSWGSRTQTFSIEGSADGVTYTEILASNEYQFSPEQENVVTVSLPESVRVRHIRLSFSGNTGAPGAQVGELQVFGSEMSKVDKFVNITKTDSSAAVLEKPIPDSPDGAIILEYKVRSSAPDREMQIALTSASGSEIATLLFDTDGYLKVTDGENTLQVGYYQPDTWYTVKLVIDLKAGSYDVWVDHLCRAEGLRTGATGAANALVFRVMEDDCTLSIDNVCIYDNPEQYLLTEDFNGVADIPEDWSFSKAGTAEIADVPFESDQSLRLIAEGSASKAIKELPQTSGLFSFEVKLRISGIGFAAMPVLTDSENRIAAGVAFYHNSLFAMNGDNWVKVMDGESPWAYYPADNWYKIRLVVNTFTNRYDVYVDGALRMKGLSFVEDVETVSRVSFTLATDNTAYIDSLCMYMGSSLQGGLIDSENVIDVREAPYLAKGDGVTDDTLAIQLALDDAAYTGKTVLLDDGVFLTSTLQVGNDTILYISPSAKILGIQEKTWYPLVESCEGLINYRQIGRGLVLTENASNVRIEGGGTIDGNGFYGYRVNDPATNKRLSDVRPCVILSILSDNVTIQNVNLINSAFWTLVLMESRNVTIRNVNVNSMNTPNRDGIDPCDVINCTIENCNILAGDDGLCFKSSCLVGCANIDVRNLTIQSRSNGIKFGSDTYGSLKNLSVSDITMKNVVKSGITMQSADGAEVENLRFERVTMTEVDDPIFFSVGNRGRQPISNPGTRIGYIRNVVFKDISFTQAMMLPYSYDADVHEVLLIGLDEDHKIENVVFENVYLEMPGGYTTAPGWPSGVGSGYPEHYSAGGKSNAWAYCIKYADNITFIDCENVLINDDVRPEITYYDGYSDEPAEYDKTVLYVLPTRLDVEAGISADELPLPETVDVIVDYDQVVTVPVTWQIDGAYSPNVEGTYQFIGTLAEVEGIRNSNARDAVATVTVKTVVPGFSLGNVDSSTGTLSTGNHSAFLSTRSGTESGTFDLRLILVSEESLVQTGDVVEIVFNGAESEHIYLRTVSDEYLQGSTMKLYQQVIAAGVTYTADEGCVIYGAVVTDIPTNGFDSVTVTVYRDGKAIVCGTAAYDEIVK